jgi:hypothetical protein
MYFKETAESSEQIALGSLKNIMLSKATILVAAILVVVISFIPFMDMILWI